MRSKLIDDFLPKVEELVERSRGRVGADAVHKKIVAMGFTGTDRTTRRAVAAAKESYRAGNRRVFRPWIPEPAMWMPWDWGEGPRIGSRRTSPWCAWLAWSRFRVVIPVFDKTLPTVAACLDATFRAIGGVPTHCLTDNEKTVTVEHVARITVRNPELVPMARDEHYPNTPRGERTPKPTNPAEAQFLAIGPGAAAWLIEAAVGDGVVAGRDQAVGGHEVDGLDDLLLGDLGAEGVPGVPTHRRGRGVAVAERGGEGGRAEAGGGEGE